MTDDQPSPSRRVADLMAAQLRAMRGRYASPYAAELDRQIRDSGQGQPGTTVRPSTTELGHDPRTAARRRAAADPIRDIVRARRGLTDDQDDDQDDEIGQDQRPETDEERQTRENAEASVRAWEQWARTGSFDPDAA